MKILTINICPPDKNRCETNVSKILMILSNEERKNIIVNLIQAENPDVIFFIEEWNAVFSLVRKQLEQELKYEFFPKCINPRIYAGVVAAAKAKYSVSFANGEGYYAKKADKWLSLIIDGHKYLGVHYPQPTIKDKSNSDVPNVEHNEFHDKVLLYAKKEEPLLIIGDFNPLKGTTTTVDGYKDVLPANKPTSAFGTKIDYIFLSETHNGAKAELIKSAMEGNNLFSDHAVTMLTL